MVGTMLFPLEEDKGSMKVTPMTSHSEGNDVAMEVDDCLVCQEE